MEILASFHNFFRRPADWPTFAQNE